MEDDGAEMVISVFSVTSPVLEILVDVDDDDDDDGDDGCGTLRFDACTGSKRGRGGWTMRAGHIRRSK